MVFALVLVKDGMQCIQEEDHAIIYPCTAKLTVDIHGTLGFILNQWYLHQWSKAFIKLKLLPLQSTYLLQMFLPTWITRSRAGSVCTHTSSALSLVNIVACGFHGAYSFGACCLYRMVQQYPSSKQSAWGCLQWWKLDVGLQHLVRGGSESWSEKVVTEMKNNVSLLMNAAGERSGAWLYKKLTWHAGDVSYVGTDKRKAWKEWGPTKPSELGTILGITFKSTAKMLFHCYAKEETKPVQIMQTIFL